MIAKFEKKILTESGQNSTQKYKNLHNLLHWHMEHEIIFVSKGSIELNVDNKIYKLTDGMGAFIKSGEIHCISGTQDSITHVIKTSSSTVFRVTKGKKLKSPVIESFEQIKKNFQDAEKELKSKKRIQRNNR